MIEIRELENAVALRGYWPEEASLIVKKEDLSDLIKSLAQYVKDDADQVYQVNQVNQVKKYGWTYLGDGVYASFDGYHVVLGTSNGGPVGNMICLDESTYDSLVFFCNQVRK